VYALQATVDKALDACTQIRLLLEKQWLSMVCIDPKMREIFEFEKKTDL
jgi:hypothetical protein